MSAEGDWEEYCLEAALFPWLDDPNCEAVVDYDEPFDPEPYFEEDEEAK